MKDLLLFARPPQPKLAVVDIGALVTTTANLLRGIRRSNGCRSELAENRRARWGTPSSSRLCL